jgi:hypothetical protein
MPGRTRRHLPPTRRRARQLADAAALDLGHAHENVPLQTGQYVAMDSRTRKSSEPAHDEIKDQIAERAMPMTAKTIAYSIKPCPLCRLLRKLPSNLALGSRMENRKPLPGRFEPSTPRARFLSDAALSKSDQHNANLRFPMAGLMPDLPRPELRHAQQCCTHCFSLPTHRRPLPLLG